MKVDIFIDLSRMPVKQIAPLFEQLTCSDGLGSLRLTYTAVLPDSADVPSYAGNWRIAYAGGSTQAAAVAAEEAGRQGRPLLFVLGGFVPSAESVAALLESLELDPLFGFAVPRMATHDGMGIEWQPLFPDEDGQSYLPRRAICDLPKYYIVPELVAPVVLVRSTVLANLRLSRSGFRTAAGALLHFLAKARRVGFRGVVHNRAVVPWCPKPSRTDTPDPADLWELLRLLPDSSCARVELAHLPWHTRERFLARAHSPQPDVRKSLLLDATAMGPSFNGTSECVLGLAGGLHALRHDWNVILAARPDAAEFHQLERRFPNWEIVTDQTGCRTTVAFKLSQPWAFRTMFELHQQALLNYYLVLDTIAWDVLFSAPENLDEIWRFSAQYADGLLYISDFTGSRFRTRFPLGPGVRDRTLYLSLHPRDYVRQEVPRRTLDSSRHLLVVGNSYDHKDLVQTVDTLAACFPFELIRAVGLAEATHPNVEAVA